MVDSSGSPSFQEIRDLVESWLREDWKTVEPMSAVDLTWGFKATAETGTIIDVMQRAADPDSFFVRTHGIIGDLHQAQLSRLTR